MQQRQARSMRSPAMSRNGRVTLMAPARCLFLCISWMVLLFGGSQARALAADATAAAEPPASIAVPGFWDPRRRPERPDLSRLQSIRFLTDLDYPPFDYAGPDGNPTGFNVDLA